MSASFQSGCKNSNYKKNNEWLEAIVFKNGENVAGFLSSLS